jgi:hypothetical protein
MGFFMNKEDRAAIMAIFTPVLGEELAEDIIKHRIGKKCPLTPRGARSLLKEYIASGDAVAAAEEHLNRGWVGYRSDWTKKPGSFIDTQNPISKTETPQERTERLDLFNQYRFARDEGNAQKAAELKSKLNQAMNRVQ